MPSNSSGVSLRLSAAQQEIWFAEQRLKTGNRVYKLGEYIEILGPVDPTLFELAVRQAVSEADTIQVRVTEGSDGPRQLIGVSGWSMRFIDFSLTSDAIPACESLDDGRGRACD